MKKITILLISLFCFANTSFLFVQNSEKKFSTYAEMNKEVGKCFKQQTFDEAIVVLENHLSVFPERLLPMTYNLATCYAKVQNYKKGIEKLNYGLDNGVWYNKWAFDRKIWDAYKEFDDFHQFLKNNILKRSEAQKSAKSEVLIVTPDGYDENKAYPLFFALHGGGGNVASFKNLWVSDRMEKEFIVVYMQSSIIVSMTGYSWEDADVATSEIEKAYTDINKNYKIDPSEILIGGFSSGGVAAMDIISKSTIPFSGFISLSPPMPAEFSKDYVENLKSKKNRSSIITNSKDPRFLDQRKMAEMFLNCGMQYQFIETPAIGHWFPKNLNEIIDGAIIYARSK